MPTIISGDNGIDKVANGAVDLTTDVTGLLPQTSGGTGATSLPSSGVTSLNGQTGAITNTDLYAIGSYVTGRPANTTTYNLNDTVAGSSLYSANPQAFYVSGNPDWRISYSTSSQIFTPTLVNVGTWRCLSSAGPGVTAIMPMGLWVRIS